MDEHGWEIVYLCASAGQYILYVNTPVSIADFWAELYDTGVRMGGMSRENSPDRRGLSNNVVLKYVKKGGALFMNAPPEM